mgnify:CR=1 FL=1
MQKYKHFLGYLFLHVHSCSIKDASNVYDEEVVNVNEMYFSDDEEERQLKGKNKNRKNKSVQGDRHGNDNNNNKQSRNPHRPQRGRGSFRHAGPVPSGFHQHMQPPPQYPSHPAYSQHQWSHQQPMPYGTPGVPPPPPPPQGAVNYQMYPPSGYPATQHFPLQPGQPSGYGQHPYPAGVPPPPPPPSRSNPQYAHANPNAQQQVASQPAQQQQQQQSDTVYYDYT